MLYICVYWGISIALKSSIQNLYPALKAAASRFTLYRAYQQSLIFLLIQLVKQRNINTMKNLEEKWHNIIEVADFQISNSVSMKEAMNRIKDFAAETVAGSGEIAASSEELSSRAEDLNQLIEGFKTSDEIELARELKTLKKDKKCHQYD